MKKVEKYNIMSLSLFKQIIINCNNNNVIFHIKNNNNRILQIEFIYIINFIYIIYTYLI